jgi:excisionase family DNA binding protein
MLAAGDAVTSQRNADIVHAAESLGRSVPVVLATPDEAACALRVSRSKVYALIRSGALVSVKIGGSRRIPVEALQLMVDSLVKAA